MKNIHILPTDKPSRLYSYKSNLFLTTESHLHVPSMKYQNIYITSDEEIKEGDWHLSFLRDKFEVINYLPNGGYRTECLGKEVCKIILTTDQDLDGVQAIDDEFLEWFVKNPSCEEVEVEMYQGRYFDYVGNVHITNAYKIIIPKQETLEEAAKKYFNDFSKRFGFINGAKWQEQQTIEEVFEWLTTNNYLTDLKETLIENFKNR